MSNDGPDSWSIQIVYQIACDFRDLFEIRLIEQPGILYEGCIKDGGELEELSSLSAAQDEVGATVTCSDCDCMHACISKTISAPVDTSRMSDTSKRTELTKKV